jgi:hypothetical protein
VCRVFGGGLGHCGVFSQSWIMASVPFMVLVVGVSPFLTFLIMASIAICLRAFPLYTATAISFIFKERLPGLGRLATKFRLCTIGLAGRGGGEKLPLVAGQQEQQIVPLDVGKVTFYVPGCKSKEVYYPFDGHGGPQSLSFVYAG